MIVLLVGVLVLLAGVFSFRGRGDGSVEVDSKKKLDEKSDLLDKNFLL